MMQDSLEDRNGHSQVLHDFSKIESLIKQFYGQHSERASAELQLQQLQRSHAGWQVADTCLASDDPSVSFFGALTFTIKLNQNDPSLSGGDLLDILSRLLIWVATYAAKNKIVVLRKLYSALVTLFSMPHSPWSRCIRIFAAVLASKSSLLSDRRPSPTMIDSCRTVVLDTERQPETADPSEIATKLSPAQFRHMLTFASVFAEDMGRSQFSKAQNQARQAENIHDIVPFLRVAFDRFTMGFGECGHLIFPCYTAWINYAESVLSRQSDVFGDLFGLLRESMELLPFPDTFQSAVDFFTDIFASNRGKLPVDTTAAFYNILLGSNWAQGHIKKLQTHQADIEDEDEWEQTMLFSQLTLSFGQHQTATLFSEEHEEDGPSTEQRSKIIELIHRITCSQNFENAETEVCESIADFWDNFLVDASCNNDEIDV